LTALRFDEGGLHVAAGTADGKVALFDLRSSRPVVVKDHMYGTAITSIAFHSVVGGLAGSGGASGGAARNVAGRDRCLCNTSRTVPYRFEDGGLGLFELCTLSPYHLGCNLPEGC